MQLPIQIINSCEVGIEMLFSFVIILTSLMIYFATKELYELSSYKGIKYFRQAFLFFAIAYFFRYFIKFFASLFLMPISQTYLGLLSLFVFLYASSMAVFYLLFSIIWKKSKNEDTRILLFHLLAIVLGIIGTISGIKIFIIINIILLIIIAFILLISYSESKNKESSLYLIYLLIFIFWLLNIFDILIPIFFELYKTAIYIISIMLFMTILYKVLKLSGN